MEAASTLPVPAGLEPSTSTNDMTVATTAAPVAPEWLADPFELPPPKQLSGATLAGLGAIAGLAAIALGLWAFVSTVRADGSVEVVRASSETAQAISLLSKPTTSRVPLEGGTLGSATLAVGENGRGLIVVDGLAVAPVGRTYQAWVIRPQPGSAPLPAALFTGVETVVPLAARVEPGATMGITIEKPGGSAAPTKAMRLVAIRPRS
jgi:hypothetical protein